jgi:hypothetical protein
MQHLKNSLLDIFFKERIELLPMLYSRVSSNHLFLQIQRCGGGYLSIAWISLHETADKRK